MLLRRLLQLLLHACIVAIFCTEPEPWHVLLGSAPTHPPPAPTLRTCSAAVFPPDSLFGNGTIIPTRVPTRWGSHTLVEAARALLLAAAADPANQR